MRICFLVVFFYENVNEVSENVMKVCTLKKIKDFEKKKKKKEGRFRHFVP